MAPITTPLQALAELLGEYDRLVGACDPQDQAESNRREAVWNEFKELFDRFTIAAAYDADCTVRIIDEQHVCSFRIWSRQVTSHRHEYLGELERLVDGQIGRIPGGTSEPRASLTELLLVLEQMADRYRRQVREQGRSPENDRGSIYG